MIGCDKGYAVCVSFELDSRRKAQHSPAVENQPATSHNSDFAQICLPVKSKAIDMPHPRSTALTYKPLGRLVVLCHFLSPCQHSEQIRQHTGASAYLDTAYFFVPRQDYYLCVRLEPSVKMDTASLDP